MRLFAFLSLLGAVALGVCLCKPVDKAKQLAQRQSRGRVPGYVESAYKTPSYTRNLSDLYYEREALYPTQFDYEYNYTYPYATFPFAYDNTSLFAPSWLEPYYF